MYGLYAGSSVPANNPSYKDDFSPGDAVAGESMQALSQAET
jgi:hypothetical protein